MTSRYFLVFLFFSLSYPAAWSQSTVGDLVKDGILKAKFGDYKAAMASFDKAIAMDSTQIEPYFNRGVARSELKDYKGAIKDFSKAIYLKPAYPEPYFNRAVAKDYLKDYSGALLTITTKRSTRRPITWMRT